MIAHGLSATELLVWATTIHLVVDWLGQNEWMADNKTQIAHPAGYAHAALHAVFALAVFPWPAAAALGVAHFAIDSRAPLRWWGTIVSQPADGPIALDVHLWRDQALHVLTIAIAALICATG
jgi:hypothetical protein